MHKNMAPETKPWAIICTKPPGFWGEPVDAELHRGKITDCLGVRFSGQKLGRILELLGSLERLSKGEVAELLELLA